MLRPGVQHGTARYRYDFRRPGDHVYTRVGLRLSKAARDATHLALLLTSKNVKIYKIALWLGDDVRVVQKNYAKLLPKDEDIESAFRTIRKTAGKPPGRTFALNWLAINHDLNQLNNLMGHTSPAMLWRHYHRAVTQKQAREFWKIKPPR